MLKSVAAALAFVGSLLVLLDQIGVFPVPAEVLIAPFWMLLMGFLLTLLVRLLYGGPHDH